MITVTVTSEKATYAARLDSHQGSYQVVVTFPNGNEMGLTGPGDGIGELMDNVARAINACKRDL